MSYSSGALLVAFFTTESSNQKKLGEIVWETYLIDINNCADIQPTPIIDYLRVWFDLVASNRQIKLF